MDPQRSSLLRRRFLRAQLGAVAFARRGRERIGPLVIDNLSAGGALLTGGADWRVEQTFELELHLDGGRQLQIPIQVVRLEPRAHGTSVGVRFQELAPDVEDAIHDLVLAALERDRVHATPSVVIVTPMASRVQTLASAITSMGLDPLVVVTFLDALRCLQDPRVLARDVVLDLEFGEEAVGAALEWCSKAFPTVRRILLGGTESAFSHSGAPHAVLGHSIESSRLAVALGYKALPLRDRERSTLPPAA